MVSIVGRRQNQEMKILGERIVCQFRQMISEHMRDLSGGSMAQVELERGNYSNDQDKSALTGLHGYQKQTFQKK